MCVLLCLRTIWSYNYVERQCIEKMNCIAVEFDNTWQWVQYKLFLNYTLIHVSHRQYDNNFTCDMQWMSNVCIILNVKLSHRLSILREHCYWHKFNLLFWDTYVSDCSKCILLLYSRFYFTIKGVIL